MRAAQVQGGRGSSSVCSVCTECSVCSACVVCVVCVRVCVTVEVSTEAQAQFVAETLWKLPLPLNALPRRVEPLGHVHDAGTNVSERKFMWLNVLHLCQHHIKDIGPSTSLFKVSLKAATTLWVTKSIASFNMACAHTQYGNKCCVQDASPGLPHYSLL